MDEKRDYMAQKKEDKLDHHTIDDFLGGAIRLYQPKTGYRVSMDTVLLAASVPAVPGETVMEGGTGSAGAALCLARRVQGLHVTGIEIQEGLLALARRNIVFNELQDRVSVSEGTIRDLTGQAGRFDHVMINPPFLAQGTAISPPAALKGAAHMDLNADLKDWIRFALYHLKHKGSVTIIYRADRLDELVHRLYKRFGDLRIMPLWPRSGAPAKRVVIQARKGVRGASAILPGLVLHSDGERYTKEARDILWFGEPLDLKPIVSGKRNS